MDLMRGGWLQNAQTLMSVPRRASYHDLSQRSLMEGSMLGTKKGHPMWVAVSKKLSAGCATLAPHFRFELEEDSVSTQTHTLFLDCCRAILQNKFQCLYMVGRTDLQVAWGAGSSRRDLRVNQRHQCVRGDTLACACQIDIQRPVLDRMDRASAGGIPKVKRAGFLLADGICHNDVWSVLLPTYTLPVRCLQKNCDSTC